MKQRPVHEAKNPLKTSIFWTTFLIIIFGLLGSVFAGWSIYRQTETSLKQRVETLAQALSRQELSSLEGFESDIMLAEYQRVKQELLDVRSVNQDVRFIYISTLRDGVVTFLVDSEAPDSDDYSAPGDQFLEATDEFKGVFDNQQTIIAVSYTHLTLPTTSRV